MEPAKRRIFAVKKITKAENKNKKKITNEKIIRQSRIIIIKESNILLLHRFKDGKEYYVVPGGSIESGETPEQAAVRETVEETSLKIENLRLLCELEGNLHYSYCFIAEKFKGIAKLGNGPEMLEQNQNNIFLVEWISINKIKEFILYPSGIKERILKLR
jgi:8-oxo-dGTP diphosphatase